MRLSVGTFGGASALPVLVAVAEGLFEREGLDVERSVTTDSERLRRDLADGTFDVVHLAPDNVIAWADDGDAVRAWLAGSNGPISLVSSAAVGALELRGRRLGVDSPRSGFAPILRRLLDVAGVSVDEVELVSLGATRLRYETLVDGRVDATLLTVPWSLLARRGGATVLADHTDVAPDLLTSCAASRVDWLHRERMAAAAYAAAIDAAVDWLHDPGHRSRASGLLADDAGLEPDIADEVVSTMLDPRGGWPRSSALRGDELRASWELRAAAMAEPAAPHEAYVEVVTTT